MYHRGFNGQQYNLSCMLLDFETRDLLLEFQARELTEQEVSAGYVPGGIASLGYRYSVATSDARLANYSPEACRVKIGNKVYVVTSIASALDKSAGRRYAVRGSRETVLTLE